MDQFHSKELRSLIFFSWVEVQMNPVSTTNQKVPDFGRCSFNGTKLRTPDLDRSGNAIERQTALADEHYLETIAVERRSDFFPGTKMFFGRDQFFLRCI